jgi:hypothetical protein
VRHGRWLIGCRHRLIEVLNHVGGYDEASAERMLHHGFALACHPLPQPLLDLNTDPRRPSGSDGRRLVEGRDRLVAKPAPL